MNKDQLSGVIDRFLFQNSETGFSIFILSCKKQDNTTVTGNFANIQIGQEIHLEGSWNFHAKFGKQFQASTYTTSLPTSIVGIKKYLGSGFIKGIGKVYAEKIVQYFGADTLTIIDTTPDRLFEISGVGKKRVEQIKQSWIDQKYIAKIMVFLQEKGVTSTYAAKIYKKYGHDAIVKLTQDPYRLTDDIWGIGFKTADKIAQNMGFAPGSVQRIQAGISFSLKQESNNGHVYQEIENLKEKTFQLLQIEPLEHNTQMRSALRNLHDQDKIKLITYQEKHFVGLSAMYGSEKGIAQKISQLLATPINHTVSPKEIYDSLQKAMDIELNQDQQTGIISCFDNKVSIITGGPGTGKTTLVKALIKVLEQHNFTYKLAAPTGRAAKRLMEGTRRPASTLHRLLEFDPSTMRFSHNDSNALKADFLIVDETSMLDIFLAHAMVKALSLHSHLILIGDIDQLPSVGPGNVLKDLIKSGKTSCTRLAHIFRQAQNSMIIQNAHMINQGQFPSSSLPDCKKDFYFIKEENPENCFPLITKLIQTIVKQHHIIPENVTILTPMNRGATGTQKLNHDLANYINSAHTDKQVTYVGTTYKQYDRVMQIKNNYDKKVFNGDIGIIHDIDVEEKLLIVDFDEQLISYAFDEINELVLSYAITIHKSQGSEYDAVIIPIFMQHFMLLQRNLLYTAVTRAKKLCIFIGQSKAIAMGIKNAKQEERITFLSQFLTENLSCR
ncbi:MAG TPA: ATP-dependent RecD-like DNA helicase [Candidatus Saccharimonadales bacterium]|nr:ATP-dependent RecD-like DNA helicase [Candidatus Saccharimonadales bacterium]